MVHVISELAKLFTNDVIEITMTIKRKSGDSGPLKSKHVREAVRKVQLGENFSKTKSFTSNR